MPLFPGRLRRRAIDRAVAFVTERLNGQDGLGAIFPAMANSVMMFDALGDAAHAAIARDAIERLLVVGPDEAYCQPCVSPVWDTALACHTLWKSAATRRRSQACRGLDWLHAAPGAGHDRRLGGAAARGAAGRLGFSNMRTRIIPTSMTPRLSSWRWIARGRNGSGELRPPRSRVALEWI